MAPAPDIAAKRQVAETSLLHLHAQMVEYNLRGAGARFYDAPTGEAPPQREGEPDEATLIQQSAKRHRLEALGQDVGARLAERHAHYHERMQHDLDKVKFLCKEFWEATFRKQVDVLRTNHRGLYVLTDNNFRWLATVAAPAGGDGTGRTKKGDHRGRRKNADADEAQRADSWGASGNGQAAPDDFAVFPCGVICGALTRLGLRCRVTADLYPAETGFRVSFNVQLIQS